MPPGLITAEADQGTATASHEADVPWWSFGKTVVSACALVLAEQGRLALDSPMAPHAFTLRQVLQHRAGLPDYGDLPDYHAAVARAGQPWPVAEMVRRAGADQLLFTPGQGWKYSNIGYTLVRQWIERVTALPLGQALAALIFQPLGVHGVSLALTRDDLATCWGVEPGYHPGFVYPGMLIGPAASAASFLERLLSGHLLRPETLAQMRDTHPVGGPVPGRPWSSAGYGLGLMIGLGEPGGLHTGHTGGGPGSTCAVYQLRPGRVAAAFVRDNHPARAEQAAMSLAAKAA
jgi:D-alanyl-D-alanine carboxypeptidase